MTIPDTMDIPDDFSLVSSLYGPGNWGCWCLTIISLLFTWTFNIEARQKDTITNDLLAALAIPCVAAGHLIWLVFFTDTIRLVDYVDYGTSEIRASHPAVVKHLLAAEGPLRICRTYTVLQMPLALASANKGHFKRMTYVTLAGCLVMGAQQSVLWWSSEEAALPSEERPPLFRPFGPELRFFLSSFHMALTMHYFLQPTLDSIKGDSSCVGAHAKSSENMDCQQAPGEDDCGNDLIQLSMEDNEAQLRSKVRFCYQCLKMEMDVSELKMALFACILLSADVETDEDHGFALLPRSSVGITELDQVVALMVGLVTLGCTLRDIVGAYRREMRRRESAKTREETGLGEERLLYLNSIVTGWMENQREVQGQLRSDQACDERLGRLRSQNKIFIKIMTREKLFERGSMEHEWLRRKIDKKVMEDTLKSIQRPEKVYVPSHRITQDQASSIRARIR